MKIDVRIHSNNGKCFGYIYKNSIIKLIQWHKYYIQKINAREDNI